MPENQVVHEIHLMGGRYDGMVVPCPNKAYYEAVVFLAVPAFAHLPVPETTDQGWEGHFYYPVDFYRDGEAYGLIDTDDESVYHRCRDLTWRPLKAKLHYDL